MGTELRGAVVGRGGPSKTQWLGTPVFGMTGGGGTPPFQEFSVTVTLRPREMPINWAVATAQGRRDAALVEASLRKDPRIGFELVDPHTRIGQRRSRSKAGWSNVSFGGRELLLSSDVE